MEMRELSDDQQVALVGLVEALTISDTVISESERAEINRIANELGEDRYRAALDRAERRFPGLRELKEHLAAIDDPEARELIYGVAVEEIVNSPSPDHATFALIDWLAQTWGIQREPGLAAEETEQ